MKILIIHNRYKEKGGEDTTVDNEYRMLQENNEVVDVYYFKNRGISFTELLKFLLYPVNIFSYFKVRRLINQFKPDIVHIHNFHFTASPLTFWALSHKKVPFVVTIQNFRLICPSHTLYLNGELYLKSIETPFSFKPVLDKAYNNSFFLSLWLYLSNLLHFKLNTWNLAAKYIFVANSSKTIFEKTPFSKYRSKFCLKPNFMHDDSLPAKIKNEDYFLFIGRLEDYKGIETLLKAFNLAKFKLIILGSGTKKQKIIELSKNNDRAVYLGFKEKREVLTYLSNARALIFPSEWVEGMPLTIIEALAVGTPVIASNLGAMSEMIINGQNGFTFEVGDERDLANKVKLIQDMDNYSYQELCIRTKASFKEKYTAEANYHQLMKIYNDAIAKSE